MTAARLKELQKMALLHLGLAKIPTLVQMSIADPKKVVVNKWRLPKKRVKITDEYKDELIAIIEPLTIQDHDSVTIYYKLIDSGVLPEDEDLRPTVATIRKYVRELRLKHGMPTERRGQYWNAVEKVKDGLDKHQLSEALSISVKYADMLHRKIRKELKDGKHGQNTVNSG